MKIKTFILTFLMMMSCSILFGQGTTTGNASNENWLKAQLADSDYGTIILANDIELTTGNIVIPNGRTVTIDLNGHTLSTTDNSTYIINNLGKLTIKDSNESGKGKISAYGGIYNGKTYNPNVRTEFGDVNLNAKLTIESGVIEDISSDKRAVIYNYGMLYITGGKFYGKYSGITNYGMADIKNTYIECLGADNDVAAIVNDFDITFGENVYIAGEYRAVTGTAAYTGTPIFLYAELNGKKYSSLQDAIDNAIDGDVVTLIANGTEDEVLITQKADVDVTINGNNKTFTGHMTIFGSGRHTGAETLTIKNVVFQAVDGKGECIASATMINGVNSYAHNVTVEGCTFKGNDTYSADNTFAIRFPSGGVGYDLTVNNCTADDKMFGLLWVTQVVGELIVDNCTAESVKEGIVLTNTTKATITNTRIEASIVAIRAGQAGAADGTINEFTFNNNTLKSNDIAIQIRGNATDSNLSMEKNVVSGATHISGNTADTKISADANYWDGEDAPVATTPIVVNSYYSDEDLTTLVRIPMGSDFTAYTREDAIWGEVGGNAIESFVIKVLDANNNVMGTTSLNNVNNIIDGSVYVTWSLKLDAESNQDEYWTMQWTTAPSIDNMPAKVELWVDGVKVSGGDVVLNAPDNLSKINAANIDVNGKILAYRTTLTEAVNNGDNVAILVAGTYNVPTGKNLTITGAVDGVQFGPIAEPHMGMKNYTFNNVTFNYAADSHYKGLQYAGDMVYNNCTFNGQVFLYGESETFNGCTFNQENSAYYNVWTYSAKEVAFNECTFNSAGKSVLIYHEGATTFNDVAVTKCEFNASSPVDGKAAIEMDSHRTAGINLTIDAATTANGFGSGNVSGNSLWNNKMGNDDDANNDITVVVDGDTVLEPIYVAKIGEEGHRTLQEAIGKAVAGDNTIQLLADITGDVTITQKEGVNIVINGNKAENENYTFTGVMTVFGDARHDGNETLTIKDINFVAKNGSDACILSPDRTAQNPARYSYSHNVTVDNCTFTDPDGNVNCAAIRHNDGGDVNWTLNKCTVDNTMHSLIQTNNVKGQLVIAECTVNSKNGINLNSCTNVEMTGCNFEVQGYALRSGVNTGGNLGEEKQFVLNNNILKSACDDGDAVIMFRASSVDANFSMTTNVVEGTTHISGNTAATNIAADANYWGEGLTGPVVAGTNVDVNSYYADADREQLIVTALTLQQFVEKVTEGNGTYNGTFTEGGVEKNITVKVVPVSGDARTTDDVRVPNRLQKYTNPEVYYAQYQRFSGLTDVNISNVNFVFYPAAVTVTDAWNTAGATTTADNINGELQLMNTGSVSFVNCSFEKMSVSPINAATLSVTSSEFNGLDAYAIKDVKATTATITGTTFTNCNGGFWFNNAPTTLTVTDNTFTGTGRRGAIQFSANGDYANTEMTVTGNEVTDEAAFLWQLNNTISNAQLNAILDKNNNTYETAFVEGSVELHLQGEGTADNPYLINDISDLEFFRDQVNAGNTYEGKYIKVTATEIDLNNEEWTPIAYKGKTFKGNFDGNNVTVKNLKITKALTNSAENNGIGFFGRTDSPATIENIIIENVDITGSLYVGAIVGYGYTGKHVKGCTVKGDITIDAWWYAGVIGGNGYMNLVDDCHVIGNEDSYIKGNDGSYIGGIWGFRGEGNNKITNCTVTNLNIIGVDRVGGICGIGHYGNTISGCDAEDVTVTATDPDATTIGLLVGATQGNNISGQGPTIFEDNDASGITAQIDNGDGTYTEVTNLYGTNINGSTPVTNYVAQIVGGTQYATLAEAVAAAVNNDVITLLPTNAPIAMNASLYGKNVTITGTATVDWDNGFLFVGRGGEGNATLTFDNAILTSASNSASTGIHVSGREKNTNDKYDGTVIIKNNSTIELDYLINKGTMTLDNSTLTVKNGFSVGGRPARETESGVDATATMTLSNNSKVVVNNHNGMGLGYEAIGVMDINSGSTFETTQAFLITAKGTMNVNGGNVKVVGTLTNAGTVYVTGEANLDATVTGDGWFYMNGVTLDANTKLLGAKVRFASGTNNIYGSTINDGFFQVGIGAYNGVDANVDTENGVVVNVENAVIGANGETYAGWAGTGFYDTDAEKAAAMNNAKYVLNIEHSIAEFGYLHISNDGELNVNGNATVKAWYNNSDYSFYAGEVIINGTARFDATDVLALYTKVSCDNGTDNPGTLNINEGTVYEAELHNGAVAGLNFDIRKTGIVNVAEGADLHVGESASTAADATMNIGGTATVLGELTNNGTINLTDLDAKFTAQEGLTVNNGVEGNTDYGVTYVNGAYKFAQYVAQIGDNKYLTLQEAVNAAQNNETITLLVDVEQADGVIIDSKNIVVDLNEETFTVTEGANTNNRNFKIIGTSVVTIKNGTMVAAGDYSSGAYGTVRTEGEANVTLTGLKLYNYRGNGLNIKALGGTTVAIDNTEIYSQYGGGIEAAGGTITLAETVKVEQKGMYTAPYNSMAISVNGGGIVTVAGGTYSTECITAEEANNQGTSHGPWVVGVLNSGGKLIINGGTFSNDNFGDNSLATYARGAVLADTGAEIEIKGGTFNALKAIIDMTNNLGDANNNPSALLSGGTFSADPRISGLYASNLIVVAQGYIVVENEDDTYSVVEDQVAKIGDVTYKLLHEAFDAAKDGETIVVLKEIVLTAGVTVAADKVVVLDLNGKTISMQDASNNSAYAIKNNGNLTIKDSAEGGKITFNSTTPDNSFGYATSTIGNGGHLTIENGLIENTTVGGASYAVDGIWHTGEASLTINDGTITATKIAVRQVPFSATAKNTVTINGGTLTGETAGLQMFNINNDAKLSETIIKGGEFNGTYAFYTTFTSAQASELATINIDGGTFNGYVFLYNGNNGSNAYPMTVAITDGLFNSGAYIYTKDANGNEVPINAISGGTFSVDPSDYCAEEFTAIYDEVTELYNVMRTSAKLERTLANAGWYWFSSYVNIDGITGLDKLKNALGVRGEQIKNATQFINYHPSSGWKGTLTSAKTKEMYQIKTTADNVTIYLEGSYSENLTIELKKGWNYLAYPMYDECSLNDALRGFTPQEGDIIKSKNSGNATYTNINGTLKWKGNLATLKPGEGYMYYSNSETVVSLTFSTSKSRTTIDEPKSVDYYWSCNDYEFASNMTVIAMLNIDDELVNDNYEIAAFANGECRGSARPVYVEEIDQYILFMTIHGEDVQELTFKYYDVNYGTVYELINRINYSSDAIVGSIAEPYMLTRGTTGIGEAEMSQVNIYPNPTTTGTEINLQATCDKVEVFNALGAKVAEYQNVDSIDALETAGIYVIRITNDSNVQNCKLVVR